MQMIFHRLKVALRRLLREKRLREQTPRAHQGRRWTLRKLLNFGGAKRDRTADLLVANEALSQLSYSPTRWEQPSTILTVNRANTDNSHFRQLALKPAEERVQMGAGNLTLRHSGRSPAPHTVGGQRLTEQVFTIDLQISASRHDHPGRFLLGSSQQRDRLR